MAGWLKYGLGVIAVAAVVGGIIKNFSSPPDAQKQIAAAPITCPPIADVGPPVSSATNFTVKFEASVKGDPRKPTVVGRTNLPAGTQLMVNLERSESAYKAEAKSTVGNDGCFSGGPFSRSGGPINGGEYVVDVLMPVSSVQPQAVQALIGRKGQNLRGPLVKPFSLTGFGQLGKVADYRAKFTLGTADAQKDAEARQDEKNAQKKRLADLRTSAAILAAKTLKANLRNPSSADWISVYANENGSAVCLILRAQNGFGGMNIERYAYVNEKFSDTASIWNKNCAGDGFYDLTRTIRWVL